MDFIFYTKQLAFVFFVLLFIILVLPHLDREKKMMRHVVIFITLFLGARYLSWRLFVTTLPVPMPTVEGFWIWSCFIAECMVLIEALTFYLIMFRDTNRIKQADKYEIVLRSMNPNELPVVDVFIPTMNEELEVVERSILGALHLDWPQEKLRVWVLDDGKRDWLRDYCIEKGAGYIRRKENKHAKAGNINNAIKNTNADYIAVFDADFVPHRQFLFRTMGFFTDPKIGIVQTPQFFFNKDYVQANLHLHGSSPDEQRIFFDVMMPARDAWDSAFWCGSCSVARRKALEEIGGVPTDSITEDLLTTLIMIRHKYITRYLSEKLSHGLAPESLTGLVIQRERWCRGTIQAMYSKNGPFGLGLNFIQRVLFLPIHWIFSPIARLMNFLIPIVFLWTGVPALLIGHFSYTVDYHAPFLLMNFFVLMWLAPRHHIPLLNTAMLSLSSIHILPSMVSSLISPFSKGFGVTPKGNKHKRIGTDWYSFIISVSLFILTFLGLVLNVMNNFAPVMDTGFFPVAAFWGTINLIIAGIMILLSIEHPRWRTDERFFVNKNFNILVNDTEHTLYLHDISMGGFHANNPKQGLFTLDQQVYLIVPGIGPVSGIITRLTDERIHVQFEFMPPKLRDAMICHIFTGKYHNHTNFKSYLQVIRDLTHRAFGHHEKIYTPQKHEHHKRETK